MTGERDASTASVAERLVRGVALAAAVMLGLATFAGVLPGSSIFLGLLESDPFRDAARAAGALLLGGCLAFGGLDAIRRALAAVGTGALALAIVTAWTGAAGAAEAGLTIAFAAVVLTSCRVGARIRAGG